MPNEILYREKYSVSGDTALYVKGQDRLSVVRLSSDINFHRGSGIYCSLKNFLIEVFLPEGYPDSVRDDYWGYQCWDTLQAFCSTITGTITTQAVMKGFGVGDSAASALGATVTWVLRDGVGMVGRIAFAWWKGSALDADCKKWRLCADFLNDIAMFLELALLPYVSTMYVLCVTSAMKAIVGVAGGATRASITQHHAIRNNMGDVSAKDGSQETCVNLIGSFVGVLILSFIDSRYLTLLFMITLMVHLYANYRAVKTLNFVTFNTERLALYLKSYIACGKTELPKNINANESVIVGTGYSVKELCGYRILFGSSIKSLVNSKKINSQELKLLSHMYKKRDYIIISSTSVDTMYVVFSSAPSTLTVLQAYYHAVLHGIATSYLSGAKLSILNVEDDETAPLSRLKNTMSKKDESQKALRIPVEAVMVSDELIDKEFQHFLTDVSGIGWNTEKHLIHIDQCYGEWKDLVKEPHISPKKTE